MSAQPVIPIEIKQLAQEIADRNAGAMQNQLFELAALLAQARNVRPIAAQKWTPNYLAVAPVAPQNPLQIIGRSETRVGVYIQNLNVTAANRLYVGYTSQITAGGSQAWPIPGGLNDLSRLWIPAQDDIFVISATAAHEFSWIVVDWADAGVGND